jgi:hypothetical protein
MVVSQLRETGEAFGIAILSPEAMAKCAALLFQVIETPLDFFVKFVIDNQFKAAAVVLHRRSDSVHCNQGLFQAQGLPIVPGH